MLHVHQELRRRAKPLEYMDFMRGGGIAGSVLAGTYVSIVVYDELDQLALSS